MKSMHNTLLSVSRIYMTSSHAVNNIRDKVYFTNNMADKIKYKLKCEVWKNETNIEQYNEINTQ
jgi:hypothetical protein